VRIALALIAVSAASGALAAAAPAHAAGPSCSVASPQKVKAALGITVGPASVTRNGPVTVCELRTASSGLLVRFQTSETSAMFAFGRKSFAKNGIPTRTVTGIGTKAYSASLQGSTTLVVLQQTTELLVTSTLPLAKLEALARLILPSL
jgi:hypothetical protein